MENNRFIVDVTGKYEQYYGDTRPTIVYRNNERQEIGQQKAYSKLGISDTNDNSDVVLFIHGFNFTHDYAAEVFDRMVDKICIGSTIKNTKFICIRWDSSANDTNDNFTGKLSKFIGGLLPGAVGEEIQKTGNSGFINNRYIEDLDRVTDSLRGISWLVNDLARSNKKIHLIGHSMGCQAVVNCVSFICHDNSTLTSAYYNSRSNTEVSDTVVGNIRNVFLIAPDVNIGLFRLLVVSGMAKLARLNKFTIYSNDEDIAIYSSELIRVHNHRLGKSSDSVNSLNEILSDLGRLKYIRDCVDKVDVLNLGTSTWRHALEDVVFAVPRSLASKDYPFSHNYYTNDDVCRDIGRVVFGGARDNVQHHQITGNLYKAGVIGA